MNRFAKMFTLAVACLLLVGIASAQQLPTTLTQSFIYGTSVAPPAIVNSQTASTSSGTGVYVASTGGSVAAGTWRMCVTFMTLTGGESPCSTDSAASSVVTTTGSTNIITVSPPVLPASGTVYSNVVGYRVYVGASGGASGAEVVQTATSSICTLSASSTASCALTSPAVFTSSSGFGSGSGQSSYLAIFPAVAQQASQAIFENSQYSVHTLYWTVSGTAPGTCTVQLYAGTTPSSLSGVGSSASCAATGSIAYYGTAAYFGVDVSAFVSGSGVGTVTFNYTAQQFSQIAYTYLCTGAAGASIACTMTNNTNLKVVFGQLTNSSSTTLTITSLPFASSTSFACNVTDATTAANNALKITYSSGSQIIITTTSNSDNFGFVCVGT